MNRLRHPVRAIREPFGTAGLIVACVALIAALAGGAYAAGGGLTGKQKKEVKKIAKQFAGKPGAQGATGPAGADGKQGTNGAGGQSGADGEDGAPGKDGKSVVLGNATAGECGLGGVTLEVEGSSSKKKVCNGQTGYTETLPEGKTETGAWGFLTPLQGALAPISFNIPLAEPLDSDHVHYIDENGEEVEFFGPGRSDSTECLGTPDVPLASPGNLCVYAVAEASGSSSFIATPGGGIGAGVSGARIIFSGMPAWTRTVENNEVSDLPVNSASGSWAVTAPEG
jgi:hypothetical protein